jgi:hypothetical protein
MNLDSSLLLALTTAHLLADFVFQSDQDVAGKRRLAVQWKHAAIVAGLSYLLAGDGRALPLAAVIGLTHFAIDRLKVQANRNGLGVFALDQTAHLLVIASGSWLASQLYPVQSFWASLWGAGFAKTLVVVAGIILTVKVGGVVVGRQVKPYLEDLTRRTSGKPLIETSKETLRGLAKGGKTIGELERALIFFLVMIGKPEAVAFLVAAKSIFRFGELKDRENRAEAEYITIGTLMSFTWGLVAAWTTWSLYRRM